MESRPKIKLLISGSRSLTDHLSITRLLNERLAELYSRFEIELLNGGAKGVDQIAANWAQDHRMLVTYFRPDWSKGRYAGLERNTEMINLADFVCVVWDGQSKGSADVIKKTNRLNKPLIVIEQISHT